MQHATSEHRPTPPIDSMAGRIRLLERIAELWRGDWSGHVFDGRDGCGWILMALHGDHDEVVGLDRQLTEIQESY